jgi:putative ABC transport system substrate-binding protein
VRKWYAGEFSKHGLADGRDIEITILRADPLGDELQAALTTAVALPADVIVGHANGFLARTVYLPVARGIPVVIFGVDDGADDSIEALNRRGENVTGALYSYLELVTMRLEIMKQLRPAARGAALVVEEAAPGRLKEEQFRRERPWIESLSRKIGMDVALIELPSESAPRRVIEALRASRADIAEVRCCASPDLWMALAKNGIAASTAGPERVKQGALLGGWTVGYVESAVRLAARILRGARAADIPVERAREFGLAINLRTAKALGITVPASVLLRATEVFE